MKAAIGEGVYANLDAERRGVLIDAAYLSPGQLRKVGPQLGAALDQGDFDKAAQILEQGMGPVDSKGDRARADAEFLRDPNIPGYYQVQRGEVLGVIAHKLGVTVNELMGSNPHLTNPDEINAGDVLRKPSSGDPQSQQPAAPAPSSSQQPATPPPLSGGSTGLEGGRGKAATPDATAARAASEKDLANTLAGRKLLAAFGAKPDDSETASDILRKPPSEWTEGEKDALMNASDYWENAGLQKKIKDWHDHFYGTDPKYDETGRMMRSGPVRPVPTTPTRPRTADGGDLTESVRRIGNQVFAAAAETSLPKAIKGLQIGLNDSRLAVELDESALAVDGVFGPKTRRGLRGALAALGRAPVENAFNRGFAQFRPIGRRHRPTNWA